MKASYLLFGAIIFQAACSTKNNEPSEVINPFDTIYQVNAIVETTPVQSVLNEDAADDPSIWVCIADPSKSLIIGTDKKRGICVYSLQGNELAFYPVGRVNNVDVRYNFNLNGQLIDIVGASNRSSNAITLMKVVSPDGKLDSINARVLTSEVDEVYGFCLYHDKQLNKHYAFVNGKNGVLEQWELFATPNNLIDGKIVRKLNLGSQPEGMVADDELGNLFAGEEDKGIWKFSAKASGDSSRLLLANSDTTNCNIAYDVEGISIYYASNGKGYIIASSQGNNSYALFERDGNHNYLGSFSVVDNQIDGSEETDGLDVLNLSLDNSFFQGVFVAQDGFNYDGDSLSTQNFKLVPWEKIARQFKPNLLIDNTFNVHQ